MGSDKVLRKRSFKADRNNSKIVSAYCLSFPPVSTVMKLTAKFKRGRESFQDDPRERLPKSAITPEIIEKVYDIVSGGRRTTVCQIVNTIGTSKERDSDVLPPQRRYVTMDESRFTISHHNRNNVQWIEAGASAAKKAKTVQSGSDFGIRKELC